MSQVEHVDANLALVGVEPAPRDQFLKLFESQALGASKSSSHACSSSHASIAAPISGSLPVKKWSTPSTITSFFGSGSVAKSASILAREPN